MAWHLISSGWEGEQGKCGRELSVRRRPGSDPRVGEGLAEAVAVRGEFR